jgi:hypothetical protein
MPIIPINFYGEIGFFFDHPIMKKLVCTSEESKYWVRRLLKEVRIKLRGSWEIESETHTSSSLLFLLLISMGESRTTSTSITHTHTQRRRYRAIDGTTICCRGNYVIDAVLRWTTKFVYNPFVSDEGLAVRTRLRPFYTDFAVRKPLGFETGGDTLQVDRMTERQWFTTSRLYT